MILKYKSKEKEMIAELLNTEEGAFLFKDNKVKKLTNKIQDVDLEEATKAIEKQKGKKEVNVNPKIFELLKKELGDFEIVL